MEKFPHQEYRDDLAKKLRDERAKDPEGRDSAKEILGTEQASRKYKKAEIWHRKNPAVGDIAISDRRMEKMESEHNERMRVIDISTDIIRLISEATKKRSDAFLYALDEAIEEDPEIVIEKDYPDPTKSVHVKVYAALFKDPEEKRWIPDMKSMTVGMNMLEVTLSGPDLDFLLKIKEQRDSFGGSVIGERLIIDHPDYTPELNA